MAYCYFKTELKRNSEFPEVIRFRINATVDTDEIGGNETVASLKGFIVKTFLWINSSEFHYFDGISAHTSEGYDVLTEHSDKICSALNINSDLLDETSEIIFCETAKVDPQYRNKKLALRLLREAMFSLGSVSSLMILKAHPDGDNVDDKDCIKLAKYYCSDKYLKLTEIDRTNLAGWLVSNNGFEMRYNEANDEFGFEISID